jgi:Predicted membrane protein
VTFVVELLVVLAYSVVGTLLIGLGYLLVDIATPGKLRELIWAGRNRNAAVVLCSGLLGVGMIVAAAIVASGNDFGRGITSTVGYGLLGLLMMALAFILVDMLTPGRLGELICEPDPHPAAWVTATIHIVVSGIIAAAIT